MRPLYREMSFARCASLAVCCAALLAAMTAEVAQAAAPEWQSWEAHSAQCSTTCGQGIRCRRRACLEVTPAGRAEVNMDRCFGGEKSSRECLPCRAYVECPRHGGWSEWSEWSDCQLSSDSAQRQGDTEKQEAHDGVVSAMETYIHEQTDRLALPKRGDSLELDSACGKGTRSRDRMCASPKPDTQGLLCGEDSDRVEKEPCEVPCTADLDFLSVVKELLADGLNSNPNQLVYVNHGAPVTLDCSNDAYTLALDAIEAYQHLQIQWRRNNESVTALVSRLQKFMKETEEAKGLLGSKSSSEEQSEKMEAVQLRSVGTKLTIDPVDGQHVGLYGCYMVLDEEHYLMRSFTLLTRQLPLRQFMESELTSMPTNTETLINPQLPAMEAAMVRWYHNGLPKREHLLVDWQERDWKLTLDYRDTGVWECYIMLGKRQWKTNEFQLAVTEEASFLNKFDNTYATYFLATCALIMYAVVGFPLAVVTLRQREDNWITAEEQRCIEYVRQINYLYMARYVRKIAV